MLELNDIHAYYGNIHALKGVSLTVKQGEIVSLIGGNGAGKTTTLRTIAGLMRPRDGQILFEGENLSGYKPHQLVSKGIAMVPEGRGVFAKLTVAENLKMGAFHRNDKAAINQEIEKSYAMFPRLGERKSQLAGTMSGGEQQMLAVTRALMSRPRLLLMDEPSMGLAPVLVDQIFEAIEQINNEGMTILLVEQNAHQALQVSNRGYVMQTGEIVLSDSAKALRKNEDVQKAYLGH